MARRVLATAIGWLAGCGGAGGPRPAVPEDSAEPIVVVASEPGEVRPPGLPVRVWVMSKCPYASRALLALVPVVRGLGPAAELDLQFIGRVDEQGGLSSMHGEEEVTGDLLLACVRQHPGSGDWLGFVECLMARYEAIPEGWEACAEQAAIDEVGVRTCVEGPEGASLLASSFALSERVGARGSPTFDFDGSPFSGPRTEEGFARALCSLLEGRQPPYCRQLPEPSEVPVILLGDRRCARAECDPAPVEAEVRLGIPGAKISRVDFGDELGRRLHGELGLALLPAVLVAREAVGNEDARAYLRRFDPLGDYYVKSVGRFDPARGAWRAPPSYPVELLEDARCTTRECGSAGRFVDFVERTLETTKVSRVDYGSAAGRGLFRELSQADERSPGSRRSTGPLGLPLAIFDGSFAEDADLYPRLERRLWKVDDRYVFQLGGWDPTAEICDNGIDDDGDGAVDCRDPGCGDSRACRPEKRGRLELFVMSQCPFAAKVVEAVVPVLDRFGRARSKVDFQLQFIGNVTEEGSLTSMHGAAEVEEDLRQVCAQHLYHRGYAFMDYVACRARDPRSDEWERCVRPPMDPEALRRCAEGRTGRSLLAASFELSRSLQISGSPSWLLHNRFEMEGRTSEAIARAFCERNPLAECPPPGAAPPEDEPAAGGCE